MAQNPKGEAMGLGAGSPRCPSWDEHLSILCGKLIFRKHQESHGEVRPESKGKQSRGNVKLAATVRHCEQLHPAGHGGCLLLVGAPASPPSMAKGRAQRHEPPSSSACPVLGYGSVSSQEQGPEAETCSKGRGLPKGPKKG